MPNYDEIKKKAKDALETIADVSVEAYKLAEEKAKVLAKRARLNAEITRERSLIRRAKINIGEIYYENHKNDPEDAIRQLCNDITASNDLIAAKQREIEELKKGVNISDLFDEDANECDCGCDCNSSSDNNEGDQK